MIISITLDQQWWLWKHLFCRTPIENRHLHCGCKLERHPLHGWKRQEAPWDVLPRDTTGSHKVSVSSGRNRHPRDFLISPKVLRFSSSSELEPPSVGLTTVRGEFVLKGEKAADMAALIEEHLEGLRGRSVYTLAQQDISGTGTTRRPACAYTRPKQLPSLLSLVL